MPTKPGLKKIDLAGATHIGKLRARNEDAYVVVPGAAAVLADGMGGLAHGREAADLVTQTVVAGLAQGQPAEQALLAAHQRIIQASIAAGGARMGSTAVVLTFAAMTATIHWVGDSRAYLFRQQQLQQLTRDHSVVEDLVASGSITRQQAETHPNRNVLTRAVGVRDTALESEMISVPLQVGDRLLICSDGLHGFLPQADLIDCLKAPGSAAVIAQNLIDRTLELTRAGDNITVICATVADTA